MPAGTPVAFSFLVGHGAARDRWRRNNRIVVLADFFNNRRRDLRTALVENERMDLVTNFAGEGIHILGLQSNYAFSELPAARFNAYAKEEGLGLILAVRQRARLTARPGRERYSRRAKALIQVGRPTAANQAPAIRPIGLKLEIVPERNPYALGPSRRLPLHVLYRGKRLANATVKLTNLKSDEKPLAIVVTDRAGRASFRVPATGSWLLNVVWAEPIKGDPRADFDTTFSSLTFGYD